MSLSRLETFQIATDATGHVFVLDQPSAQIFVLNPNGQVIDTIGRHGSGPGELVDPWALMPLPAGGVAAVDLGAHRIVRWDVKLQPLPPTLLHAGLDHPRAAAIGTSLVFTISSQDPSGGREYQLISSDSSRVRILAHLAKPPPRVVDLPSCNGHQISVVPLFTPTIHWDVLGHRLAVSAGPAYQIQLFEDGIEVPAIQRPLVPERATAALAQEEATDWRFNGCPVPPAEVVGAVGYLESVPLIEALAFSPRGELWVRHRVPGTRARATDVFGPTGAYLGTLDAAIPFPAAFLTPDRMLAILPDTDDIPTLTLYRLTRVK